MSDGTEPPPPPPPTSVSNIFFTLANPEAIIAAPVTNPATPPCANALLAPANVSIVACATANALLSPAKLLNAPARSLYACICASAFSIASCVFSFSKDT